MSVGFIHFPNSVSGDGRFAFVNWDDIRVPATAATGGGANDPSLTAWIDTVRLWWFIHNQDRELFFNAQLPHGYKLGTDLEAHVHWVPSGAGGAGQKVSWALEYVFQEFGGVFASSSTTISSNIHTPADNSLVADKHYITDLGTIDGSAIDSVSAMLSCRIYRDAAGALNTDDYAQDAGLLEIDFHYQIDSVGSRQEFVK